MENLSVSASVFEEQHSEQSVYQRKYYALKRKCEEVQQTKEKLVNRIHHVKKLIRKYKKHRRFLVIRLNQHNDNFMDVMQPAMFEDYSLINTKSAISSDNRLVTVSRSETTSSFSVVNYPPKRTSVLDCVTSANQQFERSDSSVIK